MAARVIQAVQAAKALLDGMRGHAGHAACSKAQAEKLSSLLQGAALTGAEGAELARAVRSTNWAMPSDLECVVSSIFKPKSEVGTARADTQLRASLQDYTHLRNFLPGSLGRAHHGGDLHRFKAPGASVPCRQAGARMALREDIPSGHITAAAVPLRSRRVS